MLTERLSLQKHFIICDCELHFVAVAAKSFQSCPTLCDPTDCSPPGSMTMGFPRQEYWSGLPFPSPWDLPDPGIQPGSPALQADSLPSEPPGKRPIEY